MKLLAMLTNLLLIHVVVCGQGVVSKKMSNKPAQGNKEMLFVETMVYPKSTADLPNYRIPALIQAFNGDLILFAEKRMCSPGDVGYKTIIMVRSTDNGKTWNDEKTLYDSGMEANSYPTTIVDSSTKTIWLFFLRDLKEFYMMKSADNGFTWSQPISIHKQVVKPSWDTFQNSKMQVRGMASFACDAVNRKAKVDDWESDWKQRYGVGAGNAGIRLTKGARAGRLMVPARHLEMVNGKRTNIAHFFYSDDNGTSWHVGGNVINPMGNEAQLIELANGDVMMNSRAQDRFIAGKKSYRLINVSKDGGDTWTTQYEDLGLPEPVCHAAIKRLSLADGKNKINRLLFSNPNYPYREAKHPYGRKNMTVKLSYDEGKTWTKGKEVSSYNSSYSDLVILQNGTIGMIYERAKDKHTDHYWDKLVFVRFNLEWLTDGADSMLTKE